MFSFLFFIRDRQCSYFRSSLLFSAFIVDRFPFATFSFSAAFIASFALKHSSSKTTMRAFWWKVASVLTPLTVESNEISFRLLLLLSLLNCYFPWWGRFSDHSELWVLPLLPPDLRCFLSYALLFVPQATLAESCDMVTVVVLRWFMAALSALSVTADETIVSGHRWHGSYPRTVLSTSLSSSSNHLHSLPLSPTSPRALHFGASALPRVFLCFPFYFISRTITKLDEPHRGATPRGSIGCF